MIVVDSGPLYAAADLRDDHNRACVEFFETASGPLVVPVSVLIETSFLVEKWLGPHAESLFLSAIATEDYRVEAITTTDIVRMAGLVTTYADLPLGAVDASVVAIAERLGATDIATLDRRHFDIVRPSHVAAFNLLP